MVSMVHGLTLKEIGKGYSEFKNHTKHSLFFFFFFASGETLMVALSQVGALCGLISAAPHPTLKPGTSFSLHCFLHGFQNTLVYPVLSGLNKSFIMKIAPMGFQLLFCLQIACEQIAETSNG